MSYETIIFEVKDGIGTLTLNRPQALNSVNELMFEELIKVLSEIRNSDEVRVVVIKGEGRAFCAGGDVKEMLAYGGDRTAPELLKHLKVVNEMTEALITLPKPVIVAVKGIATGAGVNIALACDIVYVSESAKFSEIFGQIGLCPDMGGSYLLPRLVGRNIAKELVFTYKTIDAAEAYRIGLINHVVPDDKLEEEVYALAARLAKGPTHAYALAKELINKSFETDLKTALDYEGRNQVISHLTADYLEGIAAFKEKRKPAFQGK